MKFLIEKLLISSQELDRYVTLSDKRKIQFITDFIKKQPNAKYLEPNLTSIINIIDEYGFDTALNPYLDYLTKIDFYVDQSVLNLIFDLISNRKIKPTDKWLYNKSLYTESVEYIIQKIKIVAFVNDKKNIEKYKVKFDPIFLMENDGKTFLNYSSMNRKIDEWQARINKKEDEDKKIASNKEKELEKERKEKQELDKQKSLRNKTVSDVLKNRIKPFTAVNIRKWIADNTDFKEEQQIINQYIENGVLDDYIEKVLGEKVYSNMGKSEDEVISGLLNKYIYNGYRKELIGK